MSETIVNGPRLLGAGALAHVNGSLLAHLEGTRDLLQQWGNWRALCNAGLYHAVYGTAGYAEQLLMLDDRHRVAAWIGAEAEAIVYVFSACDRNYFYPQIMSADNAAYRDRFTGQCFSLAPAMLCDLCELTMANELEIASAGAAPAEQCRRQFHALFARMQRYVTPAAFACSRRILGRDD